MQRGFECRFECSDLLQSSVVYVHVCVFVCVRARVCAHVRVCVCAREIVCVGNDNVDISVAPIYMCIHMPLPILISTRSILRQCEVCVCVYVYVCSVHLCIYLDAHA